MASVTDHASRTRSRAQLSDSSTATRFLTHPPLSPPPARCVVSPRYEIAHTYGSELIHDASHFARARRLRDTQLEDTGGGSRKRPLEAAGLPDLDGEIEAADLSLAVRRPGHGGCVWW